MAGAHYLFDEMHILCLATIVHRASAKSHPYKHTWAWQAASGGARPQQQHLTCHGRHSAGEAVALMPHKWGSGKEHADVRPAEFTCIGILIALL